ncbi:hypothetical protein Pmani_022910 [Petrolisthes manimaculis]|uniref:Glutamate receptor ionotropic, kainate 2 n=1 Tax=Petrolisthes manimaculis TaxID=1843537 RepID=A0AAE1PC87_9EUCA|nr:hypothetical protein Pmani_022910 [Petrolisthes manimaculis]
MAVCRGCRMGGCLLLLIIILLVTSSTLVSTAEHVRIGGLFEADNQRHVTAFRYAVDAINSDSSFLTTTHLSSQVEQISPADSFAASRKVCSLLSSGIVSIFGPKSPRSSWHVQSVCDSLEVPHVHTSSHYSDVGTDFSLYLYPHPDTLSQAYIDVINTLGWHKFSIFYENDDGLVRTQALLKNQLWQVTLRQLPASPDYRGVLKEAKEAGVTHMVLDAQNHNIYTVLKQAQQVGLMTSYHNYFITSLDLETIDLEEFRHGGTNITSLRLVSPDNPLVQQVIQDWVFGELNYGRTVDPPTTTLQSSNRSFLETEVALLYDGVQLVAKALTDLDRSHRVQVRPLQCDIDSSPWEYGTSLLNYIKLVQVEGLTGLIKLDSEGFRRDVTLDIIELTQLGLKRIGTWSSVNGTNYTKSDTEVQLGVLDNLHKNTLVITTILSEPYMMLRETTSQKPTTGNDRYEGFCVDLIKEMASILGFNYTFKLVDDGNYGAWDETQQRYSGMIGELLTQKADLAVGDLTINYKREQAVDFTQPWMSFGISILFAKPSMRESTSLFTFLRPLSCDVWVYLVVAYLGVSLVLFLLARLSPYERVPVYVMGEKSVSLGNQYTLCNSLWFTTGGLVQRATHHMPRACSTRIMAGIWWLFTLLMVSSYTANLVSFLTLDHMQPQLLIEGAEDLAHQTKIRYGTVTQGLTRNFFQSSQLATHQRMFSFMESVRPSVYVRSTSEGVQRVRKERGRYAFFMESLSIEYITQRNCDLMQIGGLLDSKSYGIALPPGSPFLRPLNDALLKIQEEGKLQMLKNKWWQEKRGGGRCHQDTDYRGQPLASQLTLDRIGGVFLLLLAGVGVALVVAVCELICKSRKQASEKQVSVWSEMSEELKNSIHSTPNTNTTTTTTRPRENNNPLEGSIPPPDPYTLTYPDKQQII